ncbi:hypothetical protein V6Z88_004805, partial [Aspergillus fumigatus]
HLTVESECTDHYSANHPQFPSLPVSRIIISHCSCSPCVHFHRHRLVGSPRPLDSSINISSPYIAIFLRLK